MALSMQSSQLRMRQRPTDAGKWIAPEVIIQEADSTVTPLVWTDASFLFETLGCRMSSIGGIVNFSFVARRRSESSGTTYRLHFPNREDNIEYPQIVGDMAIVSSAGSDRMWAMYTAIGVPEHRLEIASPEAKLWPPSNTGDVVQFNGTWFI